MGGNRVPYPDVPHTRIHEIFKRSRSEKIYGYGFYFEPGALYSKAHPRGSFDPSIDPFLRSSKFRDAWKAELRATGLCESALAWYPNPTQCPRLFLPEGTLILPEEGSGEDTEEDSDEDSDEDREGRLVVLGTGFDKKLHVPVSDELVQRVKAILHTDAEPSWWDMSWFEYAPPEVWIDEMEQKRQQAGK